MQATVRLCLPLPALVVRERGAVAKNKRQSARPSSPSDVLELAAHYDYH